MRNVGRVVEQAVLSRFYGVYPEDHGINRCVGARHELCSWRIRFARYFFKLNRKSRKISIKVSYL